MNKQNKQFSKVLLTTAVLALAFAACRRDKLTDINNCIECSKASQSANSLEANGNSAAAHLAASENVEIPAAIALPAGALRVATYYAVGVQKYKAREKAGNPGVYEWVFVAPQAELYDANNNKVGVHGAGPFWSVSPLDSIFAQQFSPARTAPGEDAESIDWLLLRTKDGTTPTGIFADVDYVQRIATKGGKAPLAPPVSAVETVEVKYKTVYRFSKNN